MKCKLSEKCEFGNLCKYATRHDSLTVTVLGCSSFKTKKPKTNEQWLHTATTEQLAEYLADVCDGLLDDVWGNDGNTSCYYRETEKNYWVEWLKQPHTIKE